MLHVKIFNIRYKKRETTITVSGNNLSNEEEFMPTSLKIDSLNDWLYKKTPNRQVIKPEAKSEEVAVTNVKEFEMELSNCYSYDDVLLAKTDEIIKREIKTRTGLKAEAYNVRILG